MMRNLLGNKLLLWGMPVLVLVLLDIAKLNYLLFHTLAEGFAIIVAVMICILSIKTYKYSKNTYLLFFGSTFFFVSVIDFFHTITYKGTGIFINYSTNTPTQLWIASGYLMAGSFLLSTFFINRDFSIRRLFHIYTAITFGLLVSIMWLRNFPDCYIYNQGLTTFKIVSEYIICALISIAIYIFIKQHSKIDQQLKKYIVYSMYTMLLSHLSFTLYTDVYGIMNFIGHILKIISYYFIYKGIFLKGIEDPYRKLAESYSAILRGWAQALELKDKETQGHSVRVTEMSVRLAVVLNLNEKQIEEIRVGALLHDIGKLGIPDSILLKNGPLNSEELEIMKQHPKYAKDMLENIPFLKENINIPYYHHERWDGTGYPEGLAGEEIPIEARIFALADVWDALSSNRYYRKSWSTEKIREHIKAQRGKHFDPFIADIFLGLNFT